MSRSTGFPAPVRQMILDRSGGRCELCGTSLFGVSGSVHHRRPRRMGGDKRPETSRASNGVALCGSGTSPGCHGRIESQDRAQAMEDGIILRAGQHPADVPVRLRHGLVFLTDDGGYTFCEDEEASDGQEEAAASRP